MQAGLTTTVLGVYMNNFLRTSLGTGLFILLVPILILAQNNISFQEIRFFESGVDAPPLSDRVYTTYFTTSESRYIYYELHVKNNLYNIRSNQVSIIAKYYKPDGTLMGEPVLNYTIPPEWDVAYLWHGWGWNNAGNWTPGTYRIVIYMDNVKITEALFSVYDKYWTNR